MKTISTNCLTAWASREMLSIPALLSSSGCWTGTVTHGINEGMVDAGTRDYGLSPFQWKLGRDDYWFAERAVHWCRGRAMERRKRGTLVMHTNGRVENEY
jgi:hypothetical protein